MIRALFLLLLPLSLVAAPQNLKTLLARLDPTSVSHHLAFYDLYPDTHEGQMALSRAFNLLNQGHLSYGSPTSLPLPDLSTIDTLIRMTTKPNDEQLPSLTEAERRTIRHLGSHLGNRRLEGYRLDSLDHLLRLPPEEIDLARALFLSEMSTTAHTTAEVESYEAMLDLMALQIQARLSPKSSSLDKVKEMNRFIFEELQFRFPPHSEYAKDIDLYTFLPSVMDSRRGVCLGVSILYLALAQRLDLPLEIVTPPGHIYVRFRDGKEVVNIETTARGVHVDSDEYLSLNTRELQLRDLRETVGFSHVNRASVYWSTQDFEKARKSYEIALLFIKDDPLIEELYGFTLILTGDKKRGLEVLQSSQSKRSPHLLYREPLAEDFLLGRVDEAGIVSTFISVDETRESLLEKKNELTKILKKHPKFRSGWLNLASTELQLLREKEALTCLEKLHQLDPQNPTSEYLLAALHTKRMNYPKAWQHLDHTKSITEEHQHDPEALKKLEQQLWILSPN